MGRSARSHWRGVSAFLLAVSLAGCAGDSLVGPVAVAEQAEPAARWEAGADADAVPFSCLLGWRTASGAFQFRQIEVRFPAADLHSGATRRAYLYRGGANGEDVQTAACGIPATERAARRMDRMFGVRRGAAEKPGGYTTASCPDEGCPLEPITGTACMGGLGLYPNCGGIPVDVDYAFNCFYDGTCSSSGSSGGGGAPGGGAMPGTPDEGPLLWAACIVTVIGAELSVAQVGELFSTWYHAEREVASVRRMLDAMSANPGSVSPEMFAIYQLRLDMALLRRDDARSAISAATHVSGWALAGAALVCGAAIITPTL